MRTTVSRPFVVRRATNVAYPTIHPVRCSKLVVLPCYTTEVLPFLERGFATNIRENFGVAVGAPRHARYPSHPPNGR